MIKIYIIIYELDYKDKDWTQEQASKIHEWFTLNSFIIPFLPQVGMMIDLDEFFDCEEISNQMDVILGYVTINEISIGKNNIYLYCS